jgi:hypothetical protein
MHQTITKQLGYLALGATLALALSIGYTTLAYADTATSTTGTTTTSYVFDADLSGTNQVPPVSATTSTSTNGVGTSTATTTGHARIWFDMTSATGSPTTTTMMWQVLSVWNGDDITAAHLHCGLPGANGPVVLDMYHPSASSTDVNGTLVATSTVSASDLHATTTGCSMPITTLTDLGNALKAGIIYANVHSVAYPGGVVRGQMTLTSQSSTSTSTTTPGVGTTTPPTGTTTPPTGTTTPPMGTHDIFHRIHRLFPIGMNGTSTPVSGKAITTYWKLHLLLHQLILV